MQSNALLLIVDSDKALDEAAAEATRVLEHWPTGERPPLIAEYAAAIIANPAKLRGAAAWLMFRDARGIELFEVMGRIEDRRVPAMLSCDDDAGEDVAIHQEGVVACPSGVDRATQCVMLQTLWSQSAVMKALQAEVDMLNAHRGGLADRISQIDEELRLAAQLQREFLPTTLPRVNGIHFEVMWRPAGYVSGDIYDVARLDERHIGFFVADAVGHGVPAALMTMYIKRALRTKRPSPDASDRYQLYEPGEALERLNRDMVERQAGKVRFATACYGIVDTRDLTVQIARAGHPFPMLLRADGETQMLEPEGGLLGVFPNEVFHTDIVQLHRGDRLLIYSDGFEMAFPETGEEKRIANEQYATEFEALREGELHEALTKLEQRVDLQAGSLNQRDDLTVMCMGIDVEAGEETDVVAEAA